VHRPRGAGAGARSDGDFVLKICVFGAGAIGGHLAARFAANGAEVSVVARGAQGAAIAAKGLVVRTPGETLTCHPRLGTPAELGTQDFVVVATKAPALPAVAGAIGPLLGPDTAVIFAMNGIPWWYFHGDAGPHADRRLPGVDPGDAIWQAIGPARAIGGVVYSSCEVTAPGEIKVDNATSRLVIGEPDGTLTPRLAHFAAALRGPAMIADETADIRTAIWTKLLMNLSSGPLAVLTSSAPKDYAFDPSCEAAIRALYAEGLAVATAFGCAPAVDVDRALGFSRKMTHRPSILQDLDLGRPMEIDGIYGATLELARLGGVATPTLDLLVALVKLRARAAGLYGNLTQVN